MKMGDPIQGLQLLGVVEGQRKQPSAVEAAVFPQKLRPERLAKLAAADAAGLHHLPRNRVAVQRRHTVRRKDAQRLGFAAAAAAADTDDLHSPNSAFSSDSGSAPARISSGRSPASDRMVEGVPMAVFPPSSTASIAP